MRATLFRRLTFRTGVRYSATPSAVPFTVLITFCMTLIRTQGSIPIVERYHD